MIASLLLSYKPHYNDSGQYFLIRKCKDSSVIDWFMDFVGLLFVHQIELENYGFYSKPRELNVDRK